MAEFFDGVTSSAYFGTWYLLCAVYVLCAVFFLFPQEMDEGSTRGETLATKIFYLVSGTRDRDSF